MTVQAWVPLHHISYVHSGTRKPSGFVTVQINRLRTEYRSTAIVFSTQRSVCSLLFYHFEYKKNCRIECCDALPSGAISGRCLSSECVSWRGYWNVGADERLCTAAPVCVTGWSWANSPLIHCTGSLGFLEIRNLEAAHWHTSYCPHGSPSKVSHLGPGLVNEPDSKAPERYGNAMPHFLLVSSGQSAIVKFRGFALSSL